MLNNFLRLCPGSYLCRGPPIKSQTQDKMILDPQTNDNSDFIDKPENRVKNYVVNKILELMHYFALKTLLPILADLIV